MSSLRSPHVALLGDVSEHARANDGFGVEGRRLPSVGAFLYGAPPKVVSLQILNLSTSAAVAILKAAHVTIEDFVVDSEEALLVLNARS